MVDGLLDRLGVPATAYTHGNHPVHTPIDGSAIASVHGMSGSWNKACTRPIATTDHASTPSI